jgi:hypothetical protein
METFYKLTPPTIYPHKHKLLIPRQKHLHINKPHRWLLYQNTTEPLKHANIYIQNNTKSQTKFRSLSNIPRHPTQQNYIKKVRTRIKHKQTQNTKPHTTQKH